eukprot:TRINITY_DN4097_c0_g1_i1.p1 TRINITY_DN4097_c0_g1~~TRINITY_DN4097_c0_g1_i1.p1  ORF type:complete len:348 (-),score=77.65 TRINITY_DN4097_c0_g1_i1:30-1073(-)
MTDTEQIVKVPYTRLGNTGLKVSRLCLGGMSFGDPEWRSWVLDQEQSTPIVERALELGINFFDTANMYSKGVSETVLGNIFKQVGVDRDDLVIATKLFFPIRDGPNAAGLSRKNIFREVQGSLDRLGTDYIDLYQIHRWDYDTPIEETLEALHDLVRSGKVRYIGASSMFAYQFSKALNVSKYKGITPFVTMQNHYNLIYREEEREMNPLCAQEGVGLLPWSPLARGLLAGTRSRDNILSGSTTRSNDDADNNATNMFYGNLHPHLHGNNFDIIDRVKELAEKKSYSAAQIALAWLLHKPNVVSPIIGASKMHHLEEAVQATSIELSEEDLEYLEELYLPHPIAGHA